MEKTEELDLSLIPDDILCDELDKRHYLVFKHDDDVVDYLEDAGYYVNIFYNDKLSKEDTSELIDELEARGFRVYDSGSKVDVDQIVQYHRCNDPRWEKLALEMIYDLANKVV